MSGQNWSAAATYDAYKSNYALYEKILLTAARQIEDLLDESMHRTPLVESRPKDPMSLFAKQSKPPKDGSRSFKYVDPWRDCSDLLGIRIIVPLASQKSQVQALIEASHLFQVLDVDDKSQGREYNELTYGGLHLDLLISGAVTPLSDHVRCEVQIRTLAEHTWAETEHEFIYKGPDGVSKDTKRQFARALALAELLDQELDKGVQEVSLLKSNAPLDLMKGLQALAKQMNWSLGSRGLTVDHLREIGALTDRSPSELLTLSSDFASKHRDLLNRIRDEIGPQAPEFDIRNHALAVQPEAILVAALIHENPFAFNSQIEYSDLRDLVLPIARFVDETGIFSTD